MQELTPQQQDARIYLIKIDLQSKKNNNNSHIVQNSKNKATVTASARTETF